MLSLEVEGQHPGTPPKRQHRGCPSAVCCRPPKPAVSPSDLVRTQRPPAHHSPAEPGPGPHPHVPGSGRPPGLRETGMGICRRGVPRSHGPLGGRPRVRAASTQAAAVPAGPAASAKSRSLSSLCLQRTSRAWLVGVEDLPGPPTGGMGQVLGLHSCEVSSTRRPPRGLGPGQIGKGVASTWPPAAPVLPPGVRAPARAGRGQEGPGRRPAWSLSDRSRPHESVSRFAQIPLSTSQTRQRGLGALLHGAALPSRVLQAVGTGGTAWGPT